MKSNTWAMYFGDCNHLLLLSKLTADAADGRLGGWSRKQGGSLRPRETRACGGSAPHPPHQALHYAYSVSQCNFKAGSLKLWD